MALLTPNDDDLEPDKVQHPDRNEFQYLRQLFAEACKERITVSKEALVLLTKVSNLGKGLCPLSDNLAPKVRHTEPLVLPLVKSWITAESETLKPTCSREALLLLQDCHKRISDKMPLQFPGLDEPLPKLRCRAVFEEFPAFDFAPQLTATNGMEEMENVPDIPATPSLRQETVKASTKHAISVDQVSIPKRLKPELSPKSFYSARDIYRMTGDRSVRTSYENAPARPAQPREERVTDQEKERKKGTQIRVLMTRAVKPRRQHAVESPRGTMNKLLDLDQIAQVDGTKGLIQSSEVHFGSSFKLSRPPGKDSHVQNEGARSVEINHQDLYQVRPSTAYSDIPDEALEHAKQLEETQLGSAVDEMPRPSTAYSEIPDEIFEHARAVEAPKPQNVQQATAVDRPQKVFAALIRYRQAQLSAPQAPPSRSLIFGSPFIANMSLARQPSANKGGH